MKRFTRRIFIATSVAVLGAFSPRSLHCFGTLPYIEIWLDIWFGFLRGNNLPHGRLGVNICAECPMDA